MHVHTWIFLQRSKHLPCNPGKLPSLRVTDCQNMLGSNGSSHKIQWHYKIILMMTPPRPDEMKAKQEKIVPQKSCMLNKHPYLNASKLNRFINGRTQWQR
jgi:hypothetical protein